jgi:hypothetical protein
MNAKAMAGQAWQPETKSVPAANHRMLGRQVAEQTIIAQANAGMSAERIAQVQDEIAAHALTEASNRQGQQFAREYDWTAHVLVRELKEMEAGE